MALMDKVKDRVGQLKEGRGREPGQTSVDFVIIVGIVVVIAVLVLTLLKPQLSELITAESTKIGTVTNQLSS